MMPRSRCKLCGGRHPHMLMSCHAQREVAACSSSSAMQKHSPARAWLCRELQWRRQGAFPFAARTYMMRQPRRAITEAPIGVNETPSGVNETPSGCCAREGGAGPVCIHTHARFLLGFLPRRRLRLRFRIGFSFRIGLLPVAVASVAPNIRRHVCVPPIANHRARDAAAHCKTVQAHEGVRQAAAAKAAAHKNACPIGAPYFRVCSSFLRSFWITSACLRFSSSSSAAVNLRSVDCGGDDM